MHHSDAQRERRRAGPSPSRVQSESAYGQGASTGRFEGAPSLEEDLASGFESSWHLWFLIVAAMSVAAMVLAILTFQAA